MPNPRYWAVVAHPRLYNVEAALAETDEHVWTVKRSLVRSGDRLALWRGLKDGHRGIVGLAQVLSDPEMMISSLLPSIAGIGTWSHPPSLRDECIFGSFIHRRFPRGLIRQAATCCGS